MERLKDLDEVAYVRFASVYRQFTDINTFVAEIEKLENQHFDEITKAGLKNGN